MSRYTAIYYESDEPCLILKYKKGSVLCDKNSSVIFNGNIRLAELCVVKSHSIIIENHSIYNYVPTTIHAFYKSMIQYYTSNTNHINIFKDETSIRA